MGNGAGAAAGGGGGGGANAACARADVDIEATAMAITNTIATARKNLRPIAFCHARKGRVEPRINAIPKNLRQLGKKTKF
jgi:hypothetical protein